MCIYILYLLVIDDECEVFQDFHQCNVPMIYFSSSIHQTQSMVISVNNKSFRKQIILPLLQGLNHSTQFQLIGSILHLFFIQFFIEERHGQSFLDEYCTNIQPTRITLYSKDSVKVKKHQDGLYRNLFLQLFKTPICFLYPSKLHPPPLLLWSQILEQKCD